ncbi:MAG: hypothetical protein IJ130_13010 [Solobacterium sp.]|nr:hypothetical protein [Erysipelotrichaceae bacterium]MBQ9154714.1 hypothetical protein [Solobacterium sp.]
MDELRKQLEELANEMAKSLSDVTDKASKLIESGSRDLPETFNREKKKMEIKAQIGKNQRAVAKAYARVGEAYFNYVENGTSMDEMRDVIDLIRSNNKVIELLEEQLAALEAETVQ